MARPPREFPITDDPLRPWTAESTQACFDIRWTNAKGRPGGNMRPTEASAQALAREAAERGGTGITITRIWLPRLFYQR